MLYKMIDNMTALQAQPFWDFGRYQRLEKDLEELLASHLFDVLFEGAPLLPFHQERSYQPEGDVYCLTSSGDILIFELKRSTAGDDALDQVLRYAQVCSSWTYADIDRMFRAYPKQTYGDVALSKVHQEAFGLSEPLKPEQFNRNQHMIVVGSAADEKLIYAVNYWKNKGLSIDFCPYRIFEIGGETYFEFFAKPYDVHTNPGQVKGVLFDTCRTYYPDALRWMVEKKRISAYGERRDAVHSLTKGDLVFYSHVGVGLVAASRVTGNRVKSDKSMAEEELYWDVKFETATPSDFETFPNAMSFAKVKEVTGKNFFWARIQKVPYLTAEEAEQLLVELKKCLAGEAIIGASNE